MKKEDKEKIEKMLKEFEVMEYYVFLVDGKEINTFARISEGTKLFIALRILKAFIQK